MTEPAGLAVPPPEVSDAFVTAATTVLLELTQVELLPAESRNAPVPLPDHAVMATIRLRRSVPGALALVVPAAAAIKLAARYLPPGIVPTEELVDDVISEFSNVITGHAKTNLKGTPYHFTMSTPSVERATSGTPVPNIVPLTLVASLEGESFRVLIYVDLPRCADA